MFVSVCLGKSFKAGGGSAVAAGSFLVCFSLGLALLLSPLAPMQLLWAFQASIVPIIVISKVKTNNFLFLLVSLRFAPLFLYCLFVLYSNCRQWRHPSESKFELEPG